MEPRRILELLILLLLIVLFCLDPTVRALARDGARARGRGIFTEVSGDEVELDEADKDEVEEDEVAMDEEELSKCVDI
jgi:hypothetical protein